ncbi:MAG: hypothetical protein KDA57_15700 [Planctomycetales bacterium]|nr:hypothetical protein [Planctomycetales bacterium]
MAKKSKTSDESSLWRLNGPIASLRSSLLGAEVDLRSPLSGLHDLNFGSRTIEGSVLGISTNTDLSNEGRDADDVFVRGNDLIAGYRETKERPFALQVYWSITEPAAHSVFIDLLLSLQTTLLESYPSVMVHSALHCDEIWAVSDQGAATRLQGNASDQRSVGAACLVMRAEGCEWSYAEMASFDEQSGFQLETCSPGVWGLRRELGGSFLEKGVIRRLQVRGAFLPRHEDLQLAAECLAGLSAEAPPLTA